MSARRWWYIGYREDGVRVAFRCSAEPTRETHGAAYLATWGPFTRRAALWALRHGSGNPHAQTTAQVERLAKLAPVLIGEDGYLPSNISSVAFVPSRGSAESVGAWQA